MDIRLSTRWGKTKQNIHNEKGEQAPQKTKRKLVKVKCYCLNIEYGEFGGKEFEVVQNMVTDSKFLVICYYA